MTNRVQIFCLVCGKQFSIKRFRRDEPVFTCSKKCSYDLKGINLKSNNTEKSKIDRRAAAMDIVELNLYRNSLIAQLKKEQLYTQFCSCKRTDIVIVDEFGVPLKQDNRPLTRSKSS